MTGLAAAPFSLGLGGNTNAEVPMMTCRFTVSLKLATCLSIAALSTFKSKFIKKQKPIRGNRSETKFETSRTRLPTKGGSEWQVTLTNFEPAQLKLAQTANLCKSLMWITQIFQAFACDS